MRKNSLNWQRKLSVKALSRNTVKGNTRCKNYIDAAPLGLGFLDGCVLQRCCPYGAGVFKVCVRVRTSPTENIERDSEIPYREGNPETISTVFRLTWMTRAIRSTIYRGSASRFGSFTIPLRLSVLTRYWSTTHSNAERLPNR